MSTEKRGGPEAVARCEAALAQMRRTLQFLEEHFTEIPDEPPGWCPIEAADLLRQAAVMLEPLPEDAEDDRRPTREQRRAAYRTVCGDEPPPDWPSPPQLYVIAGKGVRP
jgi:hypothetical protein